MTNKKIEITNEDTKNEVVKSVVAPTENEVLKKEISDLKIMFEQLMKNQTSNKQEEVKPPVKSGSSNSVYYDIEEELNINPNKMVKIISMVIGGLNLKATNNVLYFPKFGDSRKVPFEELRAIVLNHDDLARSGAFIIADEIAVKGLYLEEEYENGNILGQQDIEKIIDLPANEIVSVLKSASNIQRETMLKNIIKGITSGDNRYTDYNKNKIISDFIGQDINELAKELE